MTINLFDLFLILFLHWVADFILQTDWQAKNKSSNNVALLAHTSVYSVVWLAFGIKFTLITLVAHTITDYITSRITKRLWENKDVHNFFVVVGFDQLLHYTQLILTYYYLDL